MKIYTSVANVLLPIYFDPFFVGIGAGILAMFIGSAVTKVTDKEKEERELLFIVPEEEKNQTEIKKTKAVVALTIPLGIIISIILLVLWGIPYLKGLN